jgi:hypothetical protein
MMLMQGSSSRIRVRIVVNGVEEGGGELLRFRAPRTVEAILRSLPLEGRAALVKGGISFEVPITMGREKAVKTVSSGTIAFWPLGSALCFFFEETIPYSPVNIVGQFTVRKGLKSVKRGSIIRFEKT